MPDGLFSVRRSRTYSSSSLTSDVGQHTGVLAHFDGRANKVAPFGPGAVVVLHVIDTQQILQDEPRMTRSFADAAIGDGGLGEIDAGIGVELAEVIGGF